MNPGTNISDDVVGEWQIQRSSYEPLPTGEELERLRKEYTYQIVAAFAADGTVTMSYPDSPKAETTHTYHLGADNSLGVDPPFSSSSRDKGVYNFRLTGEKLYLYEPIENSYPEYLTKR